MAKLQLQADKAREFERMQNENRTAETANAAARAAAAAATANDDNDATASDEEEAATTTVRERALFEEKSLAAAAAAAAAATTAAAAAAAAEPADVLFKLDTLDEHTVLVIDHVKFHIGDEIVAVYSLTGDVQAATIARMAFVGHADEHSLLIDAHPVAPPPRPSSRGGGNGAASDRSSDRTGPASHIAISESQLRTKWWTLRPTPC